MIIIDLGCTEYLTPEEGFLGYPWVLEKISIAPAPLRDLRSAGCQPLDSHSIPEMQASYQTVSSEAGNKGSRRVEPFPSGNLSELVTDLRFFIYKNMTVLHGGLPLCPSLSFEVLIFGIFFFDPGSHISCYFVCLFGLPFPSSHAFRHTIFH